MQRAGVWVVSITLVGTLGCQQGPRGAGGPPPSEAPVAASGGAGPQASDPADPRRSPTPEATPASDGGSTGGPSPTPGGSTGGPSPTPGGPVIAAPGPGDNGAPAGRTTDLGDPSGAANLAVDPRAAIQGGRTEWAALGRPPGDPATFGSPFPAGHPSAGEVAELMASINRKMSHDDGKGCLEDLERVRKIDARLMATMGIMEAQCLMLIGQCQRGKRMVADYYKDQVNMTEDRAMITAESIGSMRCRGGDMTERDQLLGALFELSDGAYMNERSAAFCRERIEKVRKLAPKVKPRGPDDTQVSGGVQALFYTGAACLARAGACGEAFRAYDHDFPRGNMATIPDESQVRQIIVDSFRSSIERCKDAKLTGP